MAAGSPLTPSSDAEPKSSASRGLTPAAIALLALLLLGALSWCSRWYAAWDRARDDAAAAIAMLPLRAPGEQAKAPAELALAMQPRDNVLAMSHCRDAQCSTLHARPGAVPCNPAQGWQPQCAVVADPSEAGASLAVQFDLRPVVWGSLIDLSVSLLLCGVVIWGWRRKAPEPEDDSDAPLAATMRMPSRSSDFDPLTGLLNRVAFEEALKRHNEAAQQASQGTDGCLMYFDLDRFKYINDTHGHIAGDVVLKTVAKRLRDTLGKDVLLGRLGGDEFAVLLVDVGSPAVIERMGRVLTEAVAKPIQIDTISDYVGLSIGAYMLKRGTLSVGDMLHRADLAMYEAKKAGRGRLVMYEESMESASRGRAQVQADLKKGIEGRQMFMVYQPQFDTHDSIRGVESLVRWRHPSRGVVPPDDFVSVAEKNGLIVPLGKLILDMVCADLVELRSQGLKLPYVSVNLSLRQLSDPSFVVEVKETLQRHGLTSTDIEFEITESTAMVGQSGKENITLQQLRELGFRLAIDDFGSGYSSIGRLLDLKVDKLKIDRVFVAAIGKPHFDPALLELMIGFATRLGIKSVAEGVESVDQVVWLRNAGCQMMQGYLYAQPMNLSQLIQWMHKQEGTDGFDGGVWAPTGIKEFVDA
jgi:diguanylate cyclase (GGDEF)-like protein